MVAIGYGSGDRFDPIINATYNFGVLCQFVFSRRIYESTVLAAVKNACPTHLSDMPA